MATVTGLTADRMLAIENASVVDGEIVGGHLILTKFDGSTIDAGPAVGPAGPAGPMGPGGGYIPGEVRLWPGDVLPPSVTYGTWVWADGSVYSIAAHPLAADYIADAWRTFDGAADPGGTNFRVPDLRGLTPTGLDQMPGGARANRVTRAVSIILAGKTGKETHTLILNEIPSHQHLSAGSGNAVGGATVVARAASANSGDMAFERNAGGSAAHENMQPTVFVPYIVCLDG